MSRICSPLAQDEHQFRKPRVVSIRPNYIRKLKKRGERVRFDRNGKAKVRKPLKKISRAKRNDLREYFALSTAFLLRPENYNCACCVKRRESGENILLQKSTEVHHFRGRISSLLTDVRFFIPTCWDCGRNWIHSNPKRARELNLLAEARDWNVVPRDN